MRFSQQALALGDMASVVTGCEAALGPMRAKQQGGSTILRDEWKWFALAEVVHAEAIGRLLREGQQVELQRQLHVNALTHLAQSMVSANEASESSLLLSSAQRHISIFTIRARSNRIFQKSSTTSATASMMMSCSNPKA